MWSTERRSAIIDHCQHNKHNRPRNQHATEPGAAIAAAAPAIITTMMMAGACRDHEREPPAAV